MISGKLEGKELELTLELVKMLTDKEAAKRFAEEAAFLIPRTDIDLDENVISPLFAENVELGGTSKESEWMYLTLTHWLLCRIEHETLSLVCLQATTQKM